jgi:hypothetical protein
MRGLGVLRPSRLHERCGGREDGWAVNETRDLVRKSRLHERSCQKRLARRLGFKVKPEPRAKRRFADHFAFGGRNLRLEAKAREEAEAKRQEQIKAEQEKEEIAARKKKIGLV